MDDEDKAHESLVFQVENIIYCNYIFNCSHSFLFLLFTFGFCWWWCFFVGGVFFCELRSTQLSLFLQALASFHTSDLTQTTLQSENDSLVPSQPFEGYSSRPLQFLRGSHHSSCIKDLQVSVPVISLSLSLAVWRTS